MSNKSYLTFGLIVLAAYWLTARSGHVFFQDEERATPTRVHGGGGPTFWGTGYQGGK